MGKNYQYDSFKIHSSKKVIGERIMDVRATDGTLFEVKGWMGRAKSLEYLLGKVDDEGHRCGENQWPIIKGYCR